VDGIVSFLSMGGYWPYVWPAFGLAAVVLVGLLVASLRTLKAREAEFANLKARRVGLIGRRDRQVERNAGESE
jgi:heme exporter protein D